MPRRHHFILTSLALLTALLSACEPEQRVLGTRYGNFGESYESEPRTGARYGGFGGGGGSNEPDLPWAIALAVVSGPNHQAIAEQRRAQLATASGAKGLWIGEENDASTIYFGHYASTQDDAVRADFKHWRDLKASGLALDAVMIVPVASGISGGPIAEWDLRRAAARGKYTLQIGYYDDQFGKDFRKAAEQAVDVLRKDGAEAYFYHGPNRSMITIGVFGENDLQSATESGYSARVRALQQKFAFNLGNGLTIRQKAPDGNVTNQPSFLVNIPH